MAKYTFKQFQAEYPDDAACLAKLMEIQYGGSVTECQVCQKRTGFHPMTKRRAYACQECGHHIYPAAGTIFHKSRTKLTIWFFAMYLMTSTRHGVAAKEIERQTGVTYKCAWRICHELRKLMAATDANGMGSLGGDGAHVEIDETLVGGVIKGEGPGQRRENKTVVMGMVQRDGKIIAGPSPAAHRFKFTYETALPDRDRRFRELIIYISDKCSDDPSYGATKLNKILWGADFLSFLNRGKPITGEKYQRLEKGPAPVRLRPIRSAMEGKDIIVRPMNYYGKLQYRIVPLRSADLSIFTGEEIAVVDEVIEFCRNKSATEISELSHGKAWRTRYDSTSKARGPISRRSAIAKSLFASARICIARGT
jgi:hypothetical protein